MDELWGSEAAKGRGDSRRIKKSGRDRESWEEVGGRSSHDESHETVGTWDGWSWSCPPGSDEKSEKRGWLHRRIKF